MTPHSFPDANWLLVFVLWVRPIFRSWNFLLLMLQSGKGFEVRDVLQRSFRINVNVSGQMALPMTASMLKGHYAYFRGCVCHQRQHPFFRWHFITHGKGMNTVEIHLNLDLGKSLNHIFHHPTHLQVFIPPFLFDESLWRIYPFPSFPTCHQKQKSDWRIWGTEIPSLDQRYFFLVRVSFSSKENLVRNWFPGTNKHRDDVSEKNGNDVQYQIDIHRCVEHVKHLRLWQLDRANTGTHLRCDHQTWLGEKTLVSKTVLAVKMFVKFLAEMSGIVPQNFPKAIPWTPNRPSVFIWPWLFNPKSSCAQTGDSGWHAQMTICWTFQA